MSRHIPLYIYSAPPLEEARNTIVVKMIYLINKDILTKDQINFNAINAFFFQRGVFVGRFSIFVKKY